MESIAYYDGKIGAPEELMVPFNDRVHFFGDGCYDATVGANGKVYLLQDHLDRFFTSAKALDINVSAVAEAALKRAVAEARRKQWLTENADNFAAQAAWHERNGHPLADIMSAPGAASWNT